MRLVTVITRGYATPFVTSKIASLALPITVGVIADSVLSLISLATVSRLSTEAVAAVGLSSYLFFLVNAFLTVFASGLSVVASQALGANRKEVAARAVGETLGAALVFSVVLAASSPLWLKEYLLLTSQGNEAVASEGYYYALARMLSLPALSLGLTLSSLYRSAMHPWPPAVGSVISMAVGAAMIPALTLSPLNLGVAGAGTAVSIASFISLVVYLPWKPPLPIRVLPPRGLAARVLAVGLPAAAERLVASLAQNVYINAVARGGTEALAAHNIGLTVESLVIQPSFALSMAALVEAGRSVGAENSSEASTVVRDSARAGAIWMTFAALILAALSPTVGRFFTTNERVAELTATYLLLAAASEPGLGVSAALFGAIRGMGSVWLPLAISSFTVVFLRALPAQLLSISYGAVGAWATQVTDMYGRALLALLTWRLLGARRLSKKLV